MSFNFIEKKELEKFFLELELNKVAQTATSPEAILDVAKKLMGSLTISPLTADKADTEVFFKDLTNLDNLLKFLNTSGMRYNNKKIVIEATPTETGLNVYKGAEFSELSDQDKALYANYPDVDPQYHVYKDGLVHYLQDLKLKAGQLNVSKNLIDELIAEAQNSLKIHVSQLAYNPIKDNTSKEQNSSTNPTQTGNYSLVDYKPGQPMSSEQMELVKSIALTLPLSEDRIDFERMKGFLEAYQKADPSPGVMPSLTNALRDITFLQQYYNQPAQMTNVPVKDIAEAVITNVSGTPQQKAAAPNAYLQYLSQLLTLVGTIIGAYRSKYYSSLPEDMKQEIDQQTAYYNYNRSTIERWQSGLQDALQSIKQGIT